MALSKHHVHQAYNVDDNVIRTVSAVSVYMQTGSPRSLKLSWQHNYISILEDDL